VYKKKKDFTRGHSRELKAVQTFRIYKTSTLRMALMEAVSIWMIKITAEKATAAVL